MHTVCDSILPSQGRRLCSISRESACIFHTLHTLYVYSPSVNIMQAVDNGRLRQEKDVYFDHVELVEHPLKVLLITNTLVPLTMLSTLYKLSIDIVFSRFVVIKRNHLFDRFEVDWKVMLKEMYDKTAADRKKVVIPVLEEQGVHFETLIHNHVISSPPPSLLPSLLFYIQWFSSKKKPKQSIKHLEVDTAELATKIVKLVNQAYQEYNTTLVIRGQRVAP